MGFEEAGKWPVCLHYFYEPDLLACTSARRCFLGRPLCLVPLVPVCISGRVRMGAAVRGVLRGNQPPLGAPVYMRNWPMDPMQWPVLALSLRPAAAVPWSWPASSTKAVWRAEGGTDGSVLPFSPPLIVLAFPRHGRAYWCPIQAQGRRGTSSPGAMAPV